MCSVRYEMDVLEAILIAYYYRRTTRQIREHNQRVNDLIGEVASVEYHNEGEKLPASSI